ncbi:MAG: putative Ig domain-containing protein [Acidobacteriota bacterium]
MAVAPATLPGGTVGAPYAQTMSASGGTAPYAFTVTIGALPPGINLSTGGVLSGTPSYVGSYSFSITATDVNGCTGTQGLSIDISSNCTVVVPPAALPAGAVGVAYDVTLSASGGAPPYSFAQTSGALPSHMWLYSDGNLSGTPTQWGIYSFTVTATDQVGCVGTGAFQLAITCGMTIAPSTLPEATAGLPYAAQIQAFGGTAPYAYSVFAGALPAGLTLHPDGLLDGTPAAHGTSSFTVAAAGTDGCPAIQDYALAVHGRLDYLAGLGHGYPNGNRLKAVAPSGSTFVDLYAYAAGHWGIVVEGGDLFGDLADDIVTGPGPGPVLGPQVRGFDEIGRPISKINFYAYGTLKHGVNAAARDIDRDPFDEILTAPGAGVVFGPHVRGWSFDAASVIPIPAISFFAYATPGFGASVAAGDVDGDGYAELLTAPGPGPNYAPLIRGWYYRLAPVRAMGKVDFDAFTIPQYGANVRSGDVEGDAYDEVVCGEGPGPAIPAQSRGFNCDDATVVALPGYAIKAFSSMYGARLAIADVAPDGRADLLTGAGWDPAADTRIRVFSYTGTSLRLEPVFLTPFGPSFAYGVDVAAGGMDR